MSYFMTHLIVADKFFDDYAGNGRRDLTGKGFHIENRGMFLLGSVSPDAVHMRPDYSPDMKAVSHVLPKGIRWGGVKEESQIEAWRKNILDFYRSNILSGGQPYRDFITGYTVHMLTDDYNCVKIFGPAIKESSLEGAEFMKFYRKEASALDDYLYCFYDRSKELFNLLGHTVAPDMPGMVTSEEIAGMVDYYYRHYSEASAQYEGRENEKLAKSECGAETDPLKDQTIFDFKTGYDFIESAGEWIRRSLDI